MTVNYDAYLKSREWRNMKYAKIVAAGYKCEKCGRTEDGLDVHHLTYERLGHERMSDLQLLCRYCHKVVHGEITFPNDEGGNPNEPF